jgi:hypothetical protein
MKKVLLLAVAGVFVLASCAKDRTCECKNSTGTSVTKTTVTGVTKEYMQVEAECVSSETTQTNTNPTTGASVVTVNKRECELK